jgi:hypothetical protein
MNSTRVYDFKPLVSNSSLKKRKDEKFTTGDFTILNSGVNLVYLKESPMIAEYKH